MATIVLADDDQNIRFVLSSHLRLQGHTVKLASNGQEALDAIREERPDLVVLDLMMPVMDGYEACCVLREDPATAELPIVALTGTGGPLRGVQVRGARFDAVIAKPFRVEELQALIDTYSASASA